jgi:uncharacterized protein YcbK (DUF882 family)
MPSRRIGDRSTPFCTRLSRRSFLGAALTGSALLVPGLRRIAFGAPSRSLSFEHLHTGESLSVVYRTGSTHLPEGLARLNEFLRDHRTGEMHPIDPALFDLLYEVRTTLAVRAPFQIISGYRSPETNRMLRAQGRGVASSSLHVKGKAIDLRLPGTDTRKIREVAVELKRGGVGYYAESDFVHLDTGRVRTW